MVLKNLFYMFRSIVLYIGIYILLAMLLGQTPLGNLGGGMYLVALIMLLGGIAVLFSIRKDEFELVSKEKAKPVWYMILNILLISMGFAIFLNQIFAYFPWDKLPGTHVTQDNDTLFGIPFFMRIVIYGFIAPFGEEMLFRGAIFGRLRKIMPFGVAALLTGLAFAIYHLNWMQGAYALIMGTLMAIMFQAYDSFLAAFLFHMIANTLVVLTNQFEWLNKLCSGSVGMVLSIFMMLAGVGMVIYQFVKYKEKSEK